MPEHIILVIVHVSKDSTLNNFSYIKNHMTRCRQLHVHSSIHEPLLEFIVVKPKSNKANKGDTKIIQSI